MVFVNQYSNQTFQIWIDARNIQLEVAYVVDIATDSHESFVDIFFSMKISPAEFSYNHSDATLQLQAKTDDENIQVNFKNSPNLSNAPQASARG